MWLHLYVVIRSRSFNILLKTTEFKLIFKSPRIIKVFSLYCLLSISVVCLWSVMVGIVIVVSVQWKLLVLE